MKRGKEKRERGKNKSSSPSFSHALFSFQRITRSLFLTKYQILVILKRLEMSPFNFPLLNFNFEIFPQWKYLTAPYAEINQPVNR